MRKLTRYVLWLFVFSVPCGIVSSVPGIGTITRLLGLVTVGAGVLTTVIEGRIRKPGVIFWFALVFAISTVLSMFWTISYAYTYVWMRTCLQSVGLIWVIREFARTREEQHSLRLAFCLGGLVFAFDLLRNFATGVQLGGTTETRYSANLINPNFVGFVLVTGFPMAWLLFLDYRGAVRVIASLYCLVAPLAVVLTASRSALLALLVALSIIPLTVRRGSLIAHLRIIVVLCGAALAIGLLVPRGSWDRVLTVREVFEGGTLSGRTDIWGVGWGVFQERPFLGTGAGTFEAAVEPIFHFPRAAHNTPLSLLVEQGIVGLCLFGSLLAACAWVISGLPLRDRKLWAVSMLAWLIFAMAADAHIDRVTWVMLGMLEAQGAVRKAHPQAAQPTLRHPKAAAEGTLARRRIMSISG